MRRWLPAILVSLALALAIASPTPPPAVFAGEGDEGGAIGGELSTPPDSALADSLLGVLPDTARVGEARRSGQRFAPNYQTKYDINRDTRNWSQTLTFGTWAGGLDVSNATTVTIGTDQTLDRDRRNNSNTFNLAYQFPNGMKLNGLVGIIRNSTVDAGRTDTQQNSENLTFGGQYSRPLRGGLSATFRFGGGTTHDERVDPLTSSRESFGPHADASANLTVTRYADWALNTSVRNSRLKSTEKSTNTTTDDHNLSADVSLTSSFKVPGFQPWKLTLGNRFSRNQYPILENGVASQETNDNLNRDVSLAAAMTPIPRLDLSGSVSYRNNDVNRVIDAERSQQSIDRALKGALAYLFSDSTRVDFRGDWSRARSLYDAVDRVFLNGDIVNSALGGSARRPVGRRAAVDVAGSYSLQSFLFDDLTRNTDDRDVVHGDFAARLNYFPIPKIATNVRFSVQHNQTIFIDASKSGTNQTQQVWAVTPTFEYRINPRITFREEGSAIANATYFNFNEAQSRLSRTTELRSTIDARVLPRLGINLRHSMRFLQDGSYRPGADGIRRFSRSREDQSRDLTLRADYTVTQGIQLGFRHNRRITDAITYQVRGENIFEVATQNRFNELELTFQVNRKLRIGPTVGANLRRYQSWNDRNTRNNYWVGSATFGYVF